MITSSVCITRYDNKIVSWLDVNSKMEQLAITDTQTDIVNNIYIGKIKHIVKNINACFVEFQKGVLGFLSINDILPEYTIKEGVDIPVQVVKEASKNKEAVLTTRLSLSGIYSIVEYGSSNISVSKKITGDKRQSLKSIFESPKYGVIIRTNSNFATNISDISDEVDNLTLCMDDIIDKSHTREQFSLLYQSDPQYLRFIKGLPVNSYERIITDMEDIYQSLVSLGATLYTDDYSFSKLYSLETKIEELLSKRIWLKSGSNIIIDYTEAMTVIDVNSAKNLSKKEQEENILNLNKEAAFEISRQLRLRNISGIIIIDFINMHKEENIQELIKYIKDQFLKDNVRCEYVDITKLGLIEVVRKKIKPPIYEILNK